MRKRTIYLSSIMVALTLLAGACKGENPGEDQMNLTPTAVASGQTNPEDTKKNQPTDAAGEPTKEAKEPTVQPTKAVDEPKASNADTSDAGAFDTEGRAVVNYGKPTVDGEAESLWEKAPKIVPEIKSGQTKVTGVSFRLLWDEGGLYVLTEVSDPVLNKASGNSYEQDSVEMFLDELCDRAASYQDDDVHYRANFDNEQSVDAGEASRFSSAVKLLQDASGTTLGYRMESTISWSDVPKNGETMGFDLQINDAGANGARLGTINIFDKAGDAWQNPTSMGILILSGKEGTEEKVVKNKLSGYLQMVKGFDLSIYGNKEIIDAPIKKAEELLASENCSQEEIDMAYQELKDTVKLLNDGSGYIAPKNLIASEELPDPYRFMDGTYVKTKEDYKKREEELLALYQYYMYGVYRDGSGETLQYQLNNDKLTITVEREGRSGSFTVTVMVPDKESCVMPDGGYPVIVGMHAGIQEKLAVANGYAVILLNTYEIASDDNKHNGAFYDIYPYGATYEEQTGDLLAWSWGASKVLDALYGGLSEELSINPENSIITGVSRWGKAAAVCGAFEKRFRLTAPSCSGAGGLAVYRYTSEGKTYDFSTKGASSSYTYTQNEPLGSLQSTGEQGWFNDKFLEFPNVNYLPVEQYMLASLCMSENRSLFIIGSCISEDWVNAPSMYLCYKAVNEIAKFRGIEDNVIVNIHKEGHAVIEEDMRYLMDYFNHQVYGTELKTDFSQLKTSVFEEEGNKDPLFDSFADEWANQ